MGRRRTFGNVRKLPSGRYQARYLDASGHRHRARLTFATIADANRSLSATEAQIARGAWVDPRVGVITLTEYASAWLECYRLLRAILNTAVTDELIVRNPCAIKGAGVERTPERPVATIAQVWALADAVEPRFRRARVDGGVRRPAVR